MFSLSPVKAALTLVSIFMPAEREREERFAIKSYKDFKQIRAMINTKQAKLNVNKIFLLTSVSKLQNLIQIICRYTITMGPSIPPRPFLLSPFLMSCVILQTSFGVRGTFEAITGCTVPSSDSLLRFPGVFFSCRANARRSGIISLSPLSLATDMTLGASALWLGTQIGAGDTPTLAL